MPSNWLYIDTNFPTFTGEESPNEKISTIQNYMYMLVEQLRYSLHNLDLSNMNKTAVERYETYLTEPIYARIEDGEGQITQLQITTQGLGLRISNAEGNITTLQATAEGLALQISDAEDDILQLGITADALAVQISAADGRISQLQHTVDSFSLSVSNGSSSSRLYLNANGVSISSARITFTGMVLFQDLETAGATTINGGNITTGTIRAITLQGNDIIGGTITGATLRSVSSSDNGLEIYYGAVTSQDAGGRDPVRRQRPRHQRRGPVPHVHLHQQRVPGLGHEAALRRRHVPGERGQHLHRGGHKPDAAGAVEHLDREPGHLGRRRERVAVPGGRPIQELCQGDKPGQRGIRRTT